MTAPTAARIAVVRSSIDELNRAQTDLWELAAPLVRTAETLDEEAKGALAQGHAALAEDARVRSRRITNELRFLKAQSTAMRAKWSQLSDVLRALGAEPAIPPESPFEAAHIPGGGDSVTTTAPGAALTDGSTAESLDRGIAWGLLLFASELARGLAEHEKEYDRYLSGGVEPDYEPIINPPTYLSAELDTLGASVSVITRLLDTSVTSRAFGTEGDGGDEDAILEMSRGIASAYADVIAFGLRVRGAAVPDEWGPVLWAFSEIARKPLTRIRDFSTTLSRRAQTHVEALREGRLPDGPLNLTLTLDLDTSAFNVEFAKLKASKAAGI